MNFLKKIMASLTSLENPFSSERSGDPRTDLWTRGPARHETAQEKFARENQEEARLAEERRPRADTEKKGRGQAN